MKKKEVETMYKIISIIKLIFNDPVVKKLAYSYPLTRGKNNKKLKLTWDIIYKLLIAGIYKKINIPIKDKFLIRELLYIDCSRYIRTKAKISEFKNGKKQYNQFKKIYRERKPKARDFKTYDTLIKNLKLSANKLNKATYL